MIDHFITMTRRVIERDGLENYQPTLLLPKRKDIRILEGVPPDVDIEAAVTGWATRNVDAEEDFFMAFKMDAEHFKVIARVHGELHEALCPCRPADGSVEQNTHGRLRS